MYVCSFHSDKISFLRLWFVYRCMVLSSVLHSNCKETNIDFRLEQSTRLNRSFSPFLIFKSEICVYGNTLSQHHRQKYSFFSMTIPIIKSNAGIEISYNIPFSVTHKLMHRTQHQGLQLILNATKLK